MSRLSAIWCWPARRRSTFKEPANILLADTKDIGGVAHGQMILQLPEDEAVAEKMIAYLKERKLEVEELEHYVG